MNNDDKKWVSELVYWACMTIVLALRGDGMFVRNRCDEHRESATKEPK